MKYRTTRCTAELGGFYPGGATQRYRQYASTQVPRACRIHEHPSTICWHPACRSDASARPVQPKADPTISKFESLLQLVRVAVVPGYIHLSAHPPAIHPTLQVTPGLQLINQASPSILSQARGKFHAYSSAKYNHPTLRYAASTRSLAESQSCCSESGP